MDRRSSNHRRRPRQASAEQEFHHNPEEESRRNDGHFEPGDIDGYGPAPLSMNMSMPHQLRTPLPPGIRPPGMQQAVGSMPMWYSQSPNYHPVFSPMHHFNETPWMGPNYGVNSSLAMARANFPNPPYHYHQPEADPSTQPVQTMAQTPQYAPIYPMPPLNHQSQQEAQLPAHPGKAMAQTPQYAPNHSIHLPIPPYNYPLPNNSNGTAGQSTHPTGRSGNQNTPQPPQMNWSGRRRGL